MKLLPLSQKTKCKNSSLNLFAKIDDEDFEWLNQWNWMLNSSRPQTYYAVSLMGGKVMVRLHRAILGLKKNDMKMVDHINGDGLDCQKCNLRICTNSENQKNKKASGTSKYLGVSWHTTKRKYINKKRELVIYENSGWLSHIVVNGKTVHLGRFKIEEDAALAYNEAAKIHHKEFANFNIISE